jgi:prepilin peptidase CpaA
MFDTIHLATFLLICAVVVVSDVMVRKVFNVIILAALIAQASFLATADASASGLVSQLEPAVTGLVVGFVLLLPLYAFRAMGAGDVKLFAVLGWWMGPAALLPVFVMASLMAGVHAVAWSAQGSMWSVAAREFGERLVAVLPMRAVRRSASDTERRRPRRGIPYAAYMAVGAVGTLVWQS